MRSLIVIALLPAVAAAQPGPEASKTVDEWIEKAAFGRGGYTNKLDWSANASVTAQAGRDRGVKTSGAGEVAWVMGRCKVLFLGAAGANDSEWSVDDTEWSGSAWGGFCVPVPKQKIEVTVRSDYQLRPSFAALPIALRSRYEGTTISIETAINFWDDGPIDHDVFVIDQFSAGFFQQDMLETAYERLAVDLTLYRWHDTEDGRQIRALALELRSAGPTDGITWGVATFAASPVGLTQWPVGELLGHRIDIDATVGLAAARIYDPYLVAPIGAPPAGPEHSDVDLYVNTAIRATREHDVLALTARRAFEPAAFDQALLDSRAELSWTRSFGNNTLAAGAFAARTERIGRRGMSESEPTGGARAAYVRRFGPAQLTLAVEGARSFFAELDDNVALDAKWAAQTSATISIAH